MNNKLLCTIFVLLFPYNIYSQVIVEIDSDKIFVEALEAYKNSNFEKAIGLTQKALKVAPEYHDIRILKIRSLWALEKFEAADEELNYLLENFPAYTEVNSLVHQRLNKFKSVEEQFQFIARTEDVFPEDVALYIRKAELLIKNRRRAEGRKLAFELLSRPGISGAERYSLQLLISQSTTDEIGLGYNFVGFSDDYSQDHSWQNLMVEYQHNFGRIPVIGRINYADRGYNNGILYEIEAYPIFGERFYAFTNLGISNGIIFPKVRSSQSLYYNFLKILEAEVGGRILIFKNNSYFTAIAGLTVYSGKFYFNARSFFGPELAQTMVQNYQGNIRYYLKNINNYAFVRLGSGISPDERIFTTHELTNPTLEAYYGIGGFNFSPRIHHLFQVSAGVLKEDLTGDISGRQLLCSLSYRYQF